MIFYLKLLVKRSLDHTLWNQYQIAIGQKNIIHNTKTVKLPSFSIIYNSLLNYMPNYLIARENSLIIMKLL